MAIHDNSTDLAIESITECLEAVKLLTNYRKPTGGMMGYAALSLLFSVTDAIGHQLLQRGDGDTWLDVLNRPEFGLSLSRTKLNKLKMWYRNPLTHAASIAPGVIVSPEDQGEPFDFDVSPIVVRVVTFYELVKRVWDGLDKTNLDPIKHTVAKTSYQEPPNRYSFSPSSLTAAVSGTALTSASSGAPFPYMLSVSGVVPTVDQRQTAKKS